MGGRWLGEGERVIGRLVSGVAQAILTLFVVSVIVFGAANLSGDPVALIVGPIQDRERAEQIREQLELDKPITTRYFDYIGDVVRGDLGVAYSKGVPVSTLIGQRMPRSLLLAGVSFLFAAMFAIPAGVYAAVKRGSWLDRLLRLVAIVAQAAPAFWVGALLIVFFSVKLRWFPVTTLGGVGGPRHWVLPGIAMATFLTAAMLRLMRSGMLEVLDSEFIKLARLEGVSERTIIWKYAFKNAALSVLTFAGQYIGLAITVAIVVEKVFAWPGMGLLGFEAIVDRDFPLIQGFVLVSTGLVVAFNLAVDLLYGLLDPRTVQ